MFTGLVAETGRVLAFTEGAGGWRLDVAAGPVRAECAIGDSVAVNGCCLTASALPEGRMIFDVVEETRRLTNFSRLQPGGAVNLEGSLRFGGKIGGHFVTGHIDGLGQIEVLEGRGADYYLKIKGPPGFGRFLVLKGSVAVDGISLTVAEVAGDSFAVWIIPHSRATTNLRERRSGDAVNLESDLLGKYVEKLLPRPSA